jgi:HK97 family phage portal protein
VRGALRALSRRGANLENPAVPLTGGRLLSSINDPSELWSPNGGGLNGPTAIGAAFRCVQIIADAIAGCPLRTFNPATRATVNIPALSSQRAGMTPFERVEMSVAHQALWGNAYWRKHYTADGRLAELVPIHPARVVPEIDDGPAAAAVGMPYVKKFMVDDRWPFSEWEILHLPGFSLDGIKGMSVIERHRRTWDLAEHGEEMADRFYRNGMLLSGFLSTDQSLNSEKATVLQDRWRAKLQGIDSAFDVAVLDNGTKFQQLSMSPSDAQFLETRKFSVTEIARLFGIPGWMINDQEKSTSWGTGMEQQFTAFVILTLKPYMQRMEQRITREVLDPRSEKAEFKVEGLLRGDSQARASFYNAGITGGWMVPNEPRALEDLPPVPWGNEPYLPHNTSAEAQAAQGAE